MARRLSFSGICSYVILLPYTIQYTPTDSSSYDEVKFGVGNGQYAYADCSGVHSRSFTDAGVSITHKFESPFRVGAHAFVAQTRDNSSPFAFFAPDIAFDFKNFSFGTTGIRVGNIDDIYVELAAIDQPPPFSGKGALRLGAGIGPSSPFSRFWIGVNGIPYSNLGVATQFEFPIQKNQYMFLNGRYGEYQNVPEYGVSIGLRIRY